MADGQFSSEGLEGEEDGGNGISVDAGSQGRCELNSNGCVKEEREGLNSRLRGICDAVDDMTVDSKTQGALQCGNSQVAGDSQKFNEDCNDMWHYIPYEEQYRFSQGWTKPDVAVVDEEQFLDC